MKMKSELNETEIRKEFDRLAKMLEKIEAAQLKAIPQIAGDLPEVIPLNTPDEDEEITVVLEEVEDRGQQQQDRTLSTSDIMQIRQLIARAKTMGF